VQKLRGARCEDHLGKSCLKRAERINFSLGTYCASMELKPISLSIVGRKTGSEEKDTLHEKYMSAVK